MSSGITSCSLYYWLPEGEDESKQRYFLGKDIGACVAQGVLAQSKVARRTYWLYLHLKKRKLTNYFQAKGLYSKNKGEGGTGFVVYEQLGVYSYTDNLGVIQESKIGIFIVFDHMSSFEKFYQNLKPQEKRNHFFEVIFDSPSRFYLDIDFKRENKWEYVESAMENFLTQVNNVWRRCVTGDKPLNTSEDICIFSSHGKKKDIFKYSFHVIFPTLILQSCEARRVFFKEIYDGVDHLFRDHLDSSVYKSLQQFRMFDSSKVNDERIKRPMLEWKFGDIAGRFPTLYDKYIERNPNIAPERKKFLQERDYLWYSLIQEPKYLYSTIFRHQTSETLDAEKPLSHCLYCPQYNGLPQNISHITKNYATYEIPHNVEIPEPPEGFKVTSKQQGNRIFLKRTHPSHCAVCQTTEPHESQNGWLIWNENKRMFYFNCIRANENHLPRKAIPWGDVTQGPEIYIPDELIEQYCY